MHFKQNGVPLDEAHRSRNYSIRRKSLQMRELLRHPNEVAVEVDFVEVVRLAYIQKAFAHFGMAVAAVAPFEGVGTRRWL